MAAHRKYRWEEWFTQGTVVLVHGVDYHCSQSAMVQTARNNASRRGLRVSIIDNGDTIVIEVTGEVSHTNMFAVIS